MLLSIGSDIKSRLHFMPVCCLLFVGHVGVHLEQSIDDSVLSSAAAQTRCAAFPFLLGLEYAWDVCEPLTAGCCSLPCWSSALHAAGLLLAPSQGELGRPFIYCSLGGTWRPITEVPGHATSPSQQPVCILSCQESYRTYTSKE